MKIYNTQAEIDADIVDGVLKSDSSIKITFNCEIKASLKIEENIDAWDIKARDIKARDINAWNIDAWNIDARNIKAWNIDARDIDARDIGAQDIKARDINAQDISFYCFCIAYFSLKCSSIIGRRKNAFYKCLDGDVEINAKTAREV